MNKSKKLNRWIIFVLSMFGLVCFSLLYYAFVIEPFCIQVETIQYSQVEGEESLKVSVFSDTHLKSDYPVQALQKVVERLNETNPDIVVFLGDLYDNYETWHADEEVIQVLSSIKAKYGKLAVWGNRDYGGGAQTAYLSIMDQSGFTILQNSNWYIPLENGKTALFTGIDDGFFGEPMYPEKTQVYESDVELLLFHEPDLFDQYLNEDFDLALAGHTHGAQFGIPFVLDEVIDLQSQYVQGKYDKNNRSLYVNQGIGTTHISARFNRPPTITVLEIGLGK